MSTALFQAHARQVGVEPEKHSEARQDHQDDPEDDDRSVSSVGWYVRGLWNSQ